MASVVFTGAGKRHGTQTYTRDEWEALARQCGHVPCDKVGFGVDYLVASRDNTTKARDARRYSTAILTYAEWEAILARTARRDIPLSDLQREGRIARPAPRQVEVSDLDEVMRRAGNMERERLERLNSEAAERHRRAVAARVPLQPGALSGKRKLNLFEEDE